MLPLVRLENLYILFCVSCPNVYVGVWLLICSNAGFADVDQSVSVFYEYGHLVCRGCMCCGYFLCAEFSVCSVFSM
jgi:hypothetical protein